MTAGTGLLIEYVGGPKDGQRSHILRTSPNTPVLYPIEIKAFEYNLEDRTERQVGRYVRDHTGNDDAMRYLWTYLGRDHDQKEDAT